jgi:hypothetical protein
MKFSSTALVVCAVTSASAFAPASQRTALRSPIVLDMAADGPVKMSRKKRVLKTAGKVAGAAASVALATAGVPSAAMAKTAEVAKAATDTKNIVVGAAAFAGGLAAANFIDFGAVGTPDAATVDAIASAFPGAKKNKDLVKAVKSALDKYDYGSNSIVATSFCADEVNRVLEQDFSEVYDYNFNMGGLAGFPFGGITSFGAMASHIPDGGSCVVVFGPHVGVDSTGKIGTTERRGRAAGGACCGSAVAASGYVASVKSGDADKSDPPKVATDAQQNFVGNMLLPYADDLDKAKDKMTDLPYALYDAQKKMMDTIVAAGAGNVASGKVAVLGGIQINTPPGKSDYFLPLSFEVYDNKGSLVEDISNAVDCGNAKIKA